MLEQRARQLIQPGEMADVVAVEFLAEIGFDDCATAVRRVRELPTTDAEREALAECLPMLLLTLSETATPDGSLINFQRYVQSVPDREALFRYLSSNPRSVEILVKLFVGSQFLTEILLRRPGALEELTNHKMLAEFKSRQQLIEEASALDSRAAAHPSGAAACGLADDLPSKLDALRRFQHWELLRIGACDSFGLFDLKSVTVQLSLLADALVQSCLNLNAADLGIDPAGFVVLAFGKLGGEELNYSSDIDLVFLSDSDAGRYWKLGQRIIQALRDTTGEGFLYRVDMRLRPWGRSGALVNSVDSHIDYLRKHGRAWEKQALLKARPIAGNHDIGRRFLERAEPAIFSMTPPEVRANIREMKSKIEAELEKQGRTWGEVKAGAGSIRDVEFVTQGLQLIHGRENPHVRSFNTMDGLVRLADFGFVEPTEYYQLSNGYSFLRIVEHALQLMHHKQTHTLPERKRELAYLARRLDFRDADQFLRQYELHRREIRRVYDKYVMEQETADARPAGTVSQPVDLRSLMAPSYAETFEDEDIARHAELLKRLSPDRFVHVHAVEQEPGQWELTVVGENHRGELSLMCGLLFVYGFNILDGNVFTAQHVADHESTDGFKRSDAARKFVNVFTVAPPLDVVPPEVWERYQNDLTELVELVRKGKLAEAHGRLAKRVAGALQVSTGQPTALLPVTVTIDNDTPPNTTALHIEADDTIGFLYELTNALSLAGLEIERVFVRSFGHRVADTLFVTDDKGEKITDPNRLRELRAAVVLIKHFTHLLPHSPNPEAALHHFREFLERLFEKSDWIEDLSSLERPEVLQALARLLGVSNFLWEDFLRLQHDNLFPVVTNVEALRVSKSKQELKDELREELRGADDVEELRDRLNRFKDREMFRIDMRHILDHTEAFGQFAEELSDLAEAVIDAAYRLCDERLRERFGTPQTEAGNPCPVAVCALGKCGGRELGFASDVELMFIYEDNGKTTGPEKVTTAEFFEKLVAEFRQTIRARQKGIFQVDLRLRPYGKAGSLAVSREAFESYFGRKGAAWPYERQALVKLRAVAGDKAFGQRIEQIRNELIYSGEPFDVVAMRAMREKQIRQLVAANTFNAKLSPGGLVDCEYLVQGLQMTHGHRDAKLRTRSTRKAIAALHKIGVFDDSQFERLRDAYVFLRRLIDALRMVRGNARDLALPAAESEEFQFLARRLGYDHDTARLQGDLDRHTEAVRELNGILDAEAPSAHGT